MYYKTLFFIGGLCSMTGLLCTAAYIDTHEWLFLPIVFGFGGFGVVCLLLGFYKLNEYKSALKFGKQLIGVVSKYKIDMTDGTDGGDHPWILVCKLEADNGKTVVELQTGEYNKDKYPRGAKVTIMHYNGKYFLNKEAKIVC